MKKQQSEFRCGIGRLRLNFWEISEGALVEYCYSPNISIYMRDIETSVVMTTYISMALEDIIGPPTTLDKALYDCSST